MLPKLSESNSAVEEQGKRETLTLVAAIFTTSFSCRYIPSSSRALHLDPILHTRLFSTDPTPKTPLREDNTAIKGMTDYHTVNLHRAILGNSRPRREPERATLLTLRRQCVHSVPSHSPRELQDHFRIYKQRIVVCPPIGCVPRRSRERSSRSAPAG